MDITAFVCATTVEHKYEEILTNSFAKQKTSSIICLFKGKNLCKYLICVRWASWLSSQHMSEHQTSMGINVVHH